MTADDELSVLQSPATGGTPRLRLARSVVSRLAADVADPRLARRLTVQLNDAYLRLQFAFVTDDAELIRREQRACADLVGEARRAACDPERGSEAA